MLPIIDCRKPNLSELFMDYQVIHLPVSPSTRLTGFTNALGELVHVTPWYVLVNAIPMSANTADAVDEVAKVLALLNDKSLTSVHNLTLTPAWQTSEFTAFIDSKASYSQEDRTYHVRIAGSDVDYNVERKQ